MGEPRLIDSSAPQPAREMIGGCAGSSAARRATGAAGGSAPGLTNTTATAPLPPCTRIVTRRVRPIQIGSVKPPPAWSRPTKRPVERSAMLVGALPRKRTPATVAPAGTVTVPVRQIPSVTSRTGTSADACGTPAAIVATTATRMRGSRRTLAVCLQRPGMQVWKL